MSDAAVPRAARGGLWRHHDFRVFWIGETTSRLGSSVAAVALPLVAVDNLHASAFAVTSLTAGEMLAYTLLGLPAGALADRINRRPLMMACDALSFAAYISVPLAVWLGVLGIGQLIVVVLVVGIASVLFASAFPAYLPSIIDSEDLVEGNAKLTGSASAAQIAGPGLGGAIVQLAGASIGLLANAISFAVSFIGLAAIHTPETPATVAPGKRRRITHEMNDGLRFVLDDAFLRPLLILGPPINFFWTGITALRAVFLVRTVGLHAGLVGVALAAAGAGGVLGAMVARPLARRFGSSYTSLGALVLGLPCALLLPLTTRSTIGVTFYLVGQFLLVAGVVISNVLFGSFFQNYVPNHLLGRVSATTGTASYALMLTGALTAGALSELLGVRAALWILCAGITLSGLTYLKAPLRHNREFPAARTSHTQRH